LPAVLRIENGTAEIAGQRRTESWADVITRHVRETVGGLAVAGRIKLLGPLAGRAGLQRVDQRAADSNQGDRGHTGEHLARQARDARPFGAKPHGGGGIAGRSGERDFRFLVVLAHS
jgi:hypothetical protein